MGIWSNLGGIEGLASPAHKCTDGMEKYKFAPIV